MTRALAGKVSVPLTPVAWVLGLTLPGSLTVLLWEVIGFTPGGPADLTLEKLEAGLLGGRKRSAKSWLASSDSFRVILKASSVKIGSSRPI